MEVVMNLWGLLANHNLLPNRAKIKHLLWALYFMKVYPTELSTCSILGSSCGAIDPKTMRKWVWKFVQQITKLGPVVVSVVATHCWFLSHSVRCCMIKSCEKYASESNTAPPPPPPPAPPPCPCPPPPSASPYPTPPPPSSSL